MASARAPGKGKAKPKAKPKPTAKARARPTAKAKPTAKARARAKPTVGATTRPKGTRARPAPRAAPRARAAPPRPPAPAADGEARLWDLIARVERTARGALDASCAAFRAELDALDDATLVAVEAAFSAAMRRAYDRRLWSAAYLIHGGCGDDAFWDFRAGLIALGRDAFTAALADPDTLAAIDDLEDRTLFEGFQYAPGAALEARGLASAGPGHSSGEPTGGPFFGEDDAAVRRAFPRLHARFGG